MSESSPFQAVMIVAFGGPEGPDDVQPFLENVVRGKQVPPARLQEVAGHYAMFGGVSPLPAITKRQASGLEGRLRRAGLDLPVHVGMRHWHPFLADTFRAMGKTDVRRAVAFIANPHHSYASCTEYKLAVNDARRSLAGAGGPDITICYVNSWFDHDKFIIACAQRVQKAIKQLDAQARPRARLIFSAHSLPVAMAEQCRYVQQAQTTARRIAEYLGRDDWAMVYQSRSGPPHEPWLGPDVSAYVRSESDKGLQAAVLVPLGFIADHMEVLYDLHHVAGNLCHELTIPVGLAHAVNDHPVFLDMMADAVLQTYRRYERFGPLPIV